jgi:hypothetical protein
LLIRNFFGEYLRTFLIIFNLLISLPAQAFIPNFSCDDRIIVEAELIYFSPPSETSYYVMTTSISSGFLVENREANRLDDFYPGYRVSAAYNLRHDDFIAATWTDLHAKHSAEVSVTLPTVTIPILIPPVLLGGDAISLGDFASDQIHFHYSALEAIYGQKLISFVGIDLTAFGGIHYARLNSKENFFYSIIIPDIRGFIGENRSTFWGIGPELGLNLDKKIGYGFSIDTIVTGALLIGRPLDKSFTTTLDADGIPIAFSDASNQRAWRMVPYINFRVGMNYSLSYLLNFCHLTCLHGNVGIGYEMPVYFNGLSTIRFTDSLQLGISLDDYRNVTMHGLYGSLSLSF